MAAGRRDSVETPPSLPRFLHPSALDQAFALEAVTDAQWEQLNAVFPTGVCDYSLPAVGSQPTIPWQTYADGPGGVPLGDPPVSQPM